MNTTEHTPESLREWRASVIAATGQTEAQLREREAHDALLPGERDALATIAGIDWLLGDA